MERKCKHPDCYVPETSCVMGNQDANRCEFWRGDDKDDAIGPSAASEQSDKTMVPWSGGSMGLSDVGFVAARGTPTIVGIVGPQDAGKTTFLAALFLLLLRRGGTSKNVFAGSYSFLAWEQVSGHLKWSGSEIPRFPPHTTAFERRTPGLLHLAFREPSGVLRDLLFVDAPGEWFRQWAFNRDAAGADGARWVASRADVFLMFADCAALAGESRGEARVIARQILDRVINEREERPIFLVWSKCDIEISTNVRDAVGQAVQNLKAVSEFSVSVRPLPPKDEVAEDRFLNVLDEILALPLSREPAVVFPKMTGDLFLDFRGKADV